MSFSKMLELLQIKNKGKIVFCNAGSFYIAIGKDAVVLNKELGLRTTCLKPEVCKVGFPINSLEKYAELIADIGYGYIVYYYNQENEKLEVVLEHNGEKKNEINESKNNCIFCSKITEKYKKEDKYILAVKKLYEEENNILKENSKKMEIKDE